MIISKILTACLFMFIPCYAYASWVDGTWDKDCRIDKMTDKEHCQIGVHFSSIGSCSESSYLAITRTEIFFYHPCLDETEPVMLRVDKNRPHTSQKPNRKGALFQNHKKIISEMSHGDKLVIHYTDWPSGSYDKELTIIKGFNEAYTQLPK